MARPRPQPFAVYRVGGSVRDELLGRSGADNDWVVVGATPEMLIAWWAVQWAGGVAVPINTAYKGDYLRHQLHDSGSRALIVAGEFADRVEAVRASLPDLAHVVVTGSEPVRPGDRHDPPSLAATRVD